MRHLTWSLQMWNPPRHQRWAGLREPERRSLEAGRDLLSARKMGENDDCCIKPLDKRWKNKTESHKCRHFFCFTKFRQFLFCSKMIHSYHFSQQRVAFCQKCINCCWMNLKTDQHIMCIFWGENIIPETVYRQSSTVSMVSKHGQKRQYHRIAI